MACNKAPGRDDISLEFLQFNETVSRFPTQSDVLGWSNNGTTDVWHRGVHTEDRHSYHTSGL